MGKTITALTEASFAVIDHTISTITDPALRTQLSAMSLAVKVPYLLLKELLPTEADSFVKEVLESDKVTQDVIKTPEFQQALGSTIENLIYARQKERQEIIKKAFKDAYINSDDYAKDHLERLQETALTMSLPALQHLAFIKMDIFPIRDMELRSKAQQQSLPPGYTEIEYEQSLKRTTPVSNQYNAWFDQEKQRVQKEANRNPSDENSRSLSLVGAAEQKRRLQFSEYWSEYNSRGIFRQGNDPAIGTIGGGGTVQYMTEFGERLLEYVEAISLEY